MNGMKTAQSHPHFARFTSVPNYYIHNILWNLEEEFPTKWSSQIRQFVSPSRTFSIIRKQQYVSRFPMARVGHIIDVIFMWYKTLLIALVVVAFALFVSYICLNTVGLRILRLLVRMLWALTCFPSHTIRRIAKTLRNRSAQSRTQTKRLFSHP